ANGTLTVNRAPLSITADDKSKTYGDANPTLTASYSGFVNGDGVGSLDTPVSLSTTATASSNVGTYPITASAAADANYTVTFHAGTLTITTADLTITANDRSKTYGAALVLGTSAFSTSGLVNGNTVTSVTLYSAGAAAGANVNTYAVVPSAAVGTGLANYTIHYANGTLTVNRAPLSITADDKSKTYGDANPTLTASYSGFVNGDGVGSLDTPVSLSTTATASSNVGTYPITASAAADANYIVTFHAGTLTVNRRAITITANDQTKVYGNAFTFTGAEFTVTTGSLASGDSALVTLTSTGSPVGATVAGSPYSIVVSNAVFTGTLASNYTVTYVNGKMTISPREGQTAYIGQTVFTTSGTSSTTAQVTLSASVQDPDGAGSVANATVTFKDLLTGKVLASGVKVSLVSNTSTSVGTANTVVTLSTGQYGVQEYLIEVSLGGSYKNLQQTGATPGTSAYNAAHPAVTVMIPSTLNTFYGAAGITKLATSAGTYGDAGAASYTVALKYNNKGTNPQGQIMLVLNRSDGIYYVKSNSITSVAFSGAQNKDVTVYTKATVYKVDNLGNSISIDGGVTLRVDAHDGGTADGDTIGFTVLSTKTSSLYYSSNWSYDSSILGWRTVQQTVTPATAAVIIA
ncbi:MAG: large repetitive protein, partial [Actinomycetota bacterium]|nr:large repetitive protein [Actinomycetota bacterium]